MKVLLIVALVAAFFTLSAPDAHANLIKSTTGMTSPLTPTSTTGLIGTLPSNTTPYVASGEPSRLVRRSGEIGEPIPLRGSTKAKLTKKRTRHTCEDGTKVILAASPSTAYVKVHESGSGTTITGYSGANFVVAGMNGDTVNVGSGEAHVTGIEGIVNLGSSSDATVVCTVDGDSIFVMQSNGESYSVPAGETVNFIDGMVAE